MGLMPQTTTEPASLIAPHAQSCVFTLQALDLLSSLSQLVFKFDVVLSNGVAPVGSLRVHVGFEACQLSTELTIVRIRVLQARKLRARTCDKHEARSINEL